MTSLLSPRRPVPEVSLHATERAAPRSRRPAPEAPAAPVGWPVAAVLAGLTVAVVSWILAAGVTVLGWLAADPGTLRAALGVGTELWLLGNGVGVRLGPVPITLVPWGSTAVTAWMLSRAGRLTARLVREEEPGALAKIALLTLLAYLAPLAGVTVLFGEIWLTPTRAAAVIAVYAAAACWGAARGLDVGWPESWPAWLRALPRAVLAAQLVLLAGGAALLTTGLVLHLSRVTLLTNALHPGVSGGIALLVAQLAYAPNAFVFATSYGLGGGFALGSGSLVAPTGSSLGVLPGVPLLAALPGNGPGDPRLLCWLGLGVLAGAVAAWVIIRSRTVVAGRGLRARRPDLTSLLGGLAGLLGGACFAGLGWVAGGDVGTLRLAGLGPQLLPMLVMGTTTLGLSGLIVGLVLGLLPPLRRGQHAAAVPVEARTDAADDHRNKVRGADSDQVGDDRADSDHDQDPDGNPTVVLGVRH